MSTRERERYPKVWWFMAVCLRAGSAATLVADEKNMLGDISSQLSFPITHTNTLPSTSSAPISVRDRRRAGALSMTGLDHLWQFWFDVTSPLPTRRLSERLKGNCVTLAWRGGSRFVSERGASWDGGCVRVCGSYKWPPFPKPLRSPLWNASPRGRRGCVGNGSWEKGSLSPGTRGDNTGSLVSVRNMTIFSSLSVGMWVTLCLRARASRLVLSDECYALQRATHSSLYWSRSGLVIQMVSTTSCTLWKHKCK